jgi:cytochrome c oxidase cbb3-type subunit 1
MTSIPYTAQVPAAHNEYAAHLPEERTQLSAIDRSIRVPALFFLVSSIFWLGWGTLLALIASISMHHIIPFVTDSEFFTFGRARSAHLNAMAFGWASNAIFAIGLWIMARLCRTTIRHGGVLLIAGVFWQVGVTLGIFGILRGDMTSVEWLEMPTYATPLLAISYALIGVWGIVAFRYRQGGHVYVSQWYILAAIFWFPWLYTVAQIMILFVPSQGVVQAITNWWFAHNVLGLWFTPMALAAIYYLIPKVLGKPIHSYYLSVLGFWSLALFYNWAGIHHLIGGPIPLWLQSAGTVASVMMVIPVIVTAINHHMTVVGSFRAVWYSPTLRFIVFGAISYTAVSLIGSAMALRDVNEITHFTHFTVGHAHHGVYAFLTMVLFGSIYYMMPRMLFCEWPSAMLIRLHFWFCAIGIGVMVVGLHVGGWIQGLEINRAATAEISILQASINTIPWLVSRSVSGVLLTLGHIFFAINFFWMMVKAFFPSDNTGPTLLQRHRAS